MEKPVVETQLRPTISCPLKEPIVIAVLYYGNNNTDLPGNDPQQEGAIERVGALAKMGCIVEIVEGVRCPLLPQAGVVQARADKVADRLAAFGPRPPAVEMGPEKLATLHATCQKPACDPDTYPWFRAAYVRVAPTVNVVDNKTQKGGH